jgi:hypothetical protein
MFLNSNTSLSMYLFYNSRIHVITLYSDHVCVYYASMLRFWHLVWILVRTDHPCLGVGYHRDKPRPTFISNKLDPSLREPMITLLKEYSDCFSWDYMEMPGLDRSIVEHRLPLKKGFRPFQQ